MIFLDTSFIFAISSEKDAHHQRALAVFRRFKGQRLAEVLLTTNHVIAEAITLSRRLGHGQAAAIGERLYAGRMAHIHWATEGEEREAFAYFLRHGDKAYSFTDCLSFVVMDRLGMTEALAVDSDFTHRFVAYPGPRPGPARS